MLRSFAYAASATELTGGPPPPEGWEEQAREHFLHGYFAVVEPSGLVPGGAAAAPRSCSRSSSSRRRSTRCATSSPCGPSGLSIPVAAIERLLAEPLGE